MTALTPMFIADDEDGPAVAVLFDLPNGDQVWSGEVSHALFEEQSPEDQAELGSDLGAFVIFSEKGGDTTILAKATDPSTAMDLATAYAEWRAGQEVGAPADGSQVEPSTTGAGRHIPSTPPFIQWNGGENPAPGKVVEYKLRSGKVHTARSEKLFWNHIGLDSDIIAYRIIPTDAETGEPS